MKRAHLLSLAMSCLLLLLQSGFSCAQETVCIQCHGSQPGRLGEPVELWEKSVHAANGISCNNCHGGDPTDMAMAMSPARGFLGVPENHEIPGFCGRCHIGVKEDYLASAHGKALDYGGPQCVTCHGNHSVVAATPDLINPSSCTRCHSYGRAEEIKSAVVATDGLVGGLETDLENLHRQGIDTKEIQGELFSLRNRFHRLFHSVDVEQVRSRTAGFREELAKIRDRVTIIEVRLSERKTSGGVVVALLVIGGILALLLYRTYRRDS